MLFTLLVLIGVYPLITLLSFLIEPLAADWLLWQRTAILTPLMVFAMLYGLIPMIQQTVRLFTKPTKNKPEGRLGT
ncbi:hypothetical protein [Thalassococcus sp. S3]|uniref:hypothetical protein n=1 Tax=Thalassococcus sp. S3 TaxID=2017482 RepID=UPI001C2C4FBA|nr:hypothetical protein [Thalassococcus sp. S3]